MTKQMLVLTFAVLALLSPAGAQTPATSPAEEELSTEAQFDVAAASAPSLVRVEVTLKYDKGEAVAEELISEERPWESEGFVLTPTRVLCDDLLIHPRFIKEIHVRCGDQLVKAKVAAWGKDHACSFLELAEPLKNAKPLTFDATKKGPYLAVTYAQNNAEWTVHVSPLYLSACLTEKGRKFLSCPANVLVTDKKGSPVGILTERQAAGGDGWKGSPLDWPVVKADDMEKTLKDIEAKADGALLRVGLSFRSPRKVAGRSMRGMDEPGDEQGTEHNAIGVLVEKQKVLVLTMLNPKATARLEKVTVHPVKGEPVGAKFECTLANYGGFLAALEKPLEGPVELSSADALSYRNVLLYSAEVYLQGESRVTYFNHGRVDSFRLGWHRQVYPGSGRGLNFFQFDADGKLAILPIARREKVTEQRRYRSDQPVETAGAYLKAVLDDVAKKTDLAKHVDSQNVPLTEQEENRLAWLGVELQPLNRELARASGVADLTRDGATGAMVSYVYEDSPAAKEGIKMGDIFLRIHVEGQPKPLDVQADSDGFSGRFPWDRLDEVPEQYYDRIPSPWQSAENALTRALTDIGFGKKFKADFFRDGKLLTREFTIVEGPQHYESADRYKSDSTGITVRDLTFEVRRYFQKKPADPGVIVSMLTAGSKGSVAGLKPYEIITHVNDKPVANVKDFEDLAKGQGELRLSVVRMTKGRTVKIVLGGPPTTLPAQSD